jgi:hypothetical protein
MVKSNREVADIDEQALLNSTADDSYKRQLSVQSMQTVPVDNTIVSKSDAENKNDEATSNSKRVSGKQRKLALEEFRQQFMNAPKIENRKPVFISETIRNDLDRIVRLFGERELSVSGLVENLARNFLETYRDDVEQGYIVNVTIASYRVWIFNARH